MVGISIKIRETTMLNIQGFNIMVTIDKITTIFFTKQNNLECARHEKGLSSYQDMWPMIFQLEGLTIQNHQVLD